MAQLEDPSRALIVAVDVDHGKHVWEYALQELWREGDRLHLVHVATTLAPQDVVLHSAPGTTYQVPGGVTGDADGGLAKVESWLEQVYVLSAGGRPVSKHVVLQSEGSSPEAVASAILQVAQEQEEYCRVGMVVVGGHKGSGLWDKLKGSVSQALTSNSPYPLIVVKDWPLVHGQAEAPTAEGAAMQQ